MKAAISFSLVLMLLVSLTGCYQYQYLTLSSDLKQNKEREFVIENDTLQLKYKFNGEGGPVQVYAYNKLDKPLFIDWTKSSLIIENKSQSYVTGQSQLNGTMSGGSYGITNNRSRYGGTYTSYSGRISGTIQTETETTFIPPKTYIEETRLPIKNAFLTIDPTKKTRVNVITNAGAISSQYANYDEASSPLQFRSFLTLSVNEDLSHSFHFENRFWVSEMIETMATPNEINEKPKNQFYNRKSTGVGETFTILGLIILIGVAAANAPHK